MRKSAPLTFALSVSLLASCSGKVENAKTDGGVLQDGSSPEGCLASPEIAYLTATIGPGPSSSAPCPVGTVTTALQVGSVASGVPSGTLGTLVTCQVSSKGSGFDVSAQVEASHGSFLVSGTVPRSGTGSGLSTSLEYDIAGTPTTFAGKNCSVTLANSSTPGFDPSTGPPIAPGRVWATVTCRDMTVAGSPGVCQGVMTFRLENCAERSGCP